MRVELKVGEAIYWVECKDQWTQRDMRQWREAGQLQEDDFSSAESINAAELRIIRSKLALVQRWASACCLVDVDGTQYDSVQELTPDAVTALDAPLYEMLQTLASRAFAQRASLGERSGGR